MNFIEIVNIVIIVLCSAVFGVMMYFRTKGSATASAAEFIALIETSGLIGKDKMAFVVSKLCEMIPFPFRSIFTPERLEQIAQEVFDNMKKYALEYLERKEKEAQEQPVEEPVEEPVE